MKAIVVKQGSAAHRLWQVVGYALLALIILWVATSFQNYQILNMSKVVADAVAILGLMIIIGRSGQVSIGQSFFVGLGAYVTAYLAQDKGWPFLATLPVSALAGLAIGFLVGIPALRIRGLYLALVTLALAAVFPVIAKLPALEEYTGGANGLPTPALEWATPSWVPGNLSDPGWQFLVMCAIAAVVFILASNMMKSRPGRSLVALRDNEVGAAVSGVWLAGWKVGAFALSAAYGAVGGSLLVFTTKIAAPETGGFAVAIALLTGAVLGGLGTLSGSVIGALAVVWVPYYTSDFMNQQGSFLIFDAEDGPILASALYGVLLIAVVFVMPGGVIYFVRWVRSKFIRFVPDLPAVSPRSGDEPAPPALEPAGAAIQTQGGEPA